MDISFSPLDKISSEIKEHHKHVKIAELNRKYHVKIAVNDVPFGWHNHPNSDEILIVLEGKIRVKFEDDIAHTLDVHDSLYIPKGTSHQTIPIGRAVNLVIEDIDTETVFEEKSLFGGAFFSPNPKCDSHSSFFTVFILLERKKERDG